MNPIKELLFKGKLKELVDFDSGYGSGDGYGYGYDTNKSLEENFKPAGAEVIE